MANNGASMADLALALEGAERHPDVCTGGPRETAAGWTCDCGRVFACRGWAEAHCARAKTGARPWCARRRLQNRLVLRRAACGVLPVFTHAAAAVLKPRRRQRLARQGAALAARLTGPGEVAPAATGGAVALCAGMVGAGLARLRPTGAVLRLSLPRRPCNRSFGGRGAAARVRVLVAATAAAAAGGSWVSCRSSRSSSS
eukprot:Hpha_TRINITY_DN16771_c1_g2::TRINITY_DN16771_c1_g2_i7::g.76018::m.76018